MGERAGEVRRGVAQTVRRVEKGDHRDGLSVRTVGTDALRTMCGARRVG